MMRLVCRCLCVVCVNVSDNFIFMSYKKNVNRFEITLELNIKTLKKERKINKKSEKKNDNVHYMCTCKN